MKSAKKRCSMQNCKKPLKLSDEIICRCGLFFCVIHRFFAEHSCAFDYKKEQQEKLKQANPKVETQKLEKI
jgi:hypothetical protein